MSLNNVRLPASVIAELYTDSLVLETSQGEIKNSLKDELTQGTAGKKSLGDNLKSILVVVNYPGISNLPDNDLKFLTGILAACKLSLADVAIVNISNYPLSGYKELTALFKSKIVLLFDVTPVDFGLPMDFPHYQIQPFTGNSFLFAPSLNKLENDRTEKTKLWTALKRLFNL